MWIRRFFILKEIVNKSPIIWNKKKIGVFCYCLNFEIQNKVVNFVENVEFDFCFDRFSGQLLFTFIEAVQKLWGDKNEIIFNFYIFFNLISLIDVHFQFFLQYWNNILKIKVFFEVWKTINAKKICIDSFSIRFIYTEICGHVTSVGKSDLKLESPKSRRSKFIPINQRSRKKYQRIESCRGK